MYHNNVLIGIKIWNIWNAMKEKKIGERPLSKKLGIGRGTLRKYFEIGQMPPYLAWETGKILDLSMNDVVSGNTVWMRLGVTVPVTDEELAYLLRESIDNSYTKHSFDDVDLEEDVAEMFLRRAVADGESYIPGCCFDKFEGRKDLL